MRKRLGHDGAATPALQRIIADRAGRIQGLFNIAGFEYVACPVRAIGPDSSEAISLQFETHGQGVGFDLARGFGIKASSGSKESGIDLNYRFEN